MLFGSSSNPQEGTSEVSPCASLPGLVLAEDSESPLGLPGETVPFRDELSFQMTVPKVQLREEAAGAWNILEKAVFGQAAAGSIASFALFDKQFAAQTGGKSDEVKTARNKNAFLGLWSYLNLAHRRLRTKFVNFVMHEEMNIIGQSSQEEFASLSKIEKGDKIAALWTASIERYAAEQLAAEGFDELAAHMTTAGQTAELTKLAWPVVRNWLLHMGIIKPNGHRPLTDIEPNGDRWGCFTEIVGKESWVVREVKKMVAVRRFSQKILQESRVESRGPKDQGDKCRCKESAMATKEDVYTCVTPMCNDKAWCFEVYKSATSVVTCTRKSEKSIKSGWRWACDCKALGAQ